MADDKTEVKPVTRLPVIPMTTILESPNLCEELDNEQSKAIGDWCKEGYDADKQSRSQWEQYYAEAMQMTMQITDKKSEPWVGASNIRFPLISIAVMHFHARVYPMLVNGNDPVKCMVYGPDPDGKRTMRADRVAKHISWQMIEQVEEWEEEQDKMVLTLGITGLGIKKTWFDPRLQRLASQSVSPANMVLNYYAVGPIDLHTRASHTYTVSRNEMIEMVRAGLWEHEDYEEPGDDEGKGEETQDANDSFGARLEETVDVQPADDILTMTQDKRTGAIAPGLDSATPVQVCEQICWIDLDGDKYAEPYFVTFEMETGCVLRVVARFNKSDITYDEKTKTILTIKPERCYDHYGLVPSPDGSFYPMGFGRLLGSLDDACSTALNQLFDAGTLTNYGGGFIGRGARMRGGQMRINPGTWQQVDSIGNDLKNNLVPYPVPQPNQVVFQLVQYLVSYAERLVSANDLQTGEDIGQNTPAATAQTMDTNGSRIVSGMYKRIHRSFRGEIRTFQSLNRKYLPADKDFIDLTTGQGAMVTSSDYNQLNYDLCPAADPTILSDAARQKRDSTVYQLATSQPNFNKYRATRRLLVSLNVPAIDEIYPPPQNGDDIEQGPSPEMMKLQIEQGKLKDRQQQTMQAGLKVKNEYQIAVMKVRAEFMRLQAEIMELQARAVLELSQAKSENEGKEIALINAAIGAKKHQMDSLQGILDRMLSLHETMQNVGADAGGDTTEGSASPMGGADAGAGDNVGGDSKLAAIAGGPGAAEGAAGGEESTGE